MPHSHATELRVRYAETDRMGLLHHANYLVYFEQARIELLRDNQVLAEGSSTLACVDRDGKLQAMPEWLQKSD